MVLYASSFFILLLSGCNHEKATEVNGSETIIKYAQCEQKHWSELPDSLLGKKQYILLDTLNSDCFFGQMSKVQIKDSLIYILDSHLKKLVVYNRSGKGVARIGKQGQGPEEYIDIADFDVAPNGNIYFIDGRIDNLFCFNNQFQFVSRKVLPFEADVLLAEENNFLFGLSSWNKGSYEGSKIVQTDTLLHVKNAYLTYDEYMDPSFWISSYSFIRSKDYIAYNQPIDNHIYLFNNQGELKESILFDFGGQNVPDEEKKNIERNLLKFDHYCMLKNFTVVTKRIIAGSFWKGRKTVPFILDRATNICYCADPRGDYDNSATAGYSDSYWISYLEPDTEILEEVPDSVSQYLTKGGFVLGLQSLY